MWVVTEPGPCVTPALTLCLCSPVSRDIMSAPVSPAGGEIKWPGDKGKINSKDTRTFLKRI